MTSDKWELVTERLDRNGIPVDTTERLKVPGGWLYRTVRDNCHADNSADIMAIVFVPSEAES